MMTHQGAELDQILAQWRRERPDIDPMCMAVCGAVWRAAKRLNDGVAQNLKQYDLDFAGMDVLLTLRRSGRNQPMKPSEMAADMMLSSAAMTARLDRLEARDLIRRSPSPDDRRSVRIALTDAGFALADAVVSTHVVAEQAMLENLDEQDQRNLVALLSLIAVARR